MKIVFARGRDLSKIKELADRNKRELGFVLRPAVQQAIDEGRILISRSASGSVTGFVHFRDRRDTRTKIYELCVGEKYRRLKVGTQIIEHLASVAKTRGQTALELLCPQDLEANAFYPRVGFSRMGDKQGRRRLLNIWIRCI
jgi:ribosomal protein S18 acetylase RimI-like enzyme